MFIAAEQSMSIKITHLVWECSHHKGETLLVLLAIANFCDDYGLAWPGAERLARKTRMQRRSIWRAVKRLAASGELSIEGHGGGRANSNRYRITLTSPTETVKLSHPLSNEIYSDTQTPFQPLKGDFGALKGCPTVTRSVIDPSLRIRSMDQAGFWDTKPASIETADAVSHTRFKSRKKKLHASSPGKQASSSSISQGKPEKSHRSQRSDRTPNTSDKALSIFRKELIARYPATHKNNLYGAQRWITANKPDEAARAAILVRLDRWIASEQWQREDGRFIPDISHFLEWEKYQADPPDYTPPQSQPQRKEDIW